MAAPNLLFGKPTPTAARVIKIGFVGPRTGALAHFDEGKDFVLSEIRKRVSMGLVLNSMIRNVEIIEKDSESNSNRAAEIASGLIKSDRLNNNRRT
jgi:branched-chain amino acid transport system substrate-binding protein